MVAQLVLIVIDCPDPSGLAPFYEALLGATRVEDSPDWVTLAVGDEQPRVALQRSERYVAPDWTRGDPPQQIHLDLLVDNLDDSEAQVLALGARLLDGSDKPVGYRVYADPVGHPFCLVTPGGLT
jgi:catechol 2,3-dioxygenase-like lactoylglutathione lyase family enzyme